jgi:hypothetical protein
MNFEDKSIIKIVFRFYQIYVVGLFACLHKKKKTKMFQERQNCIYGYLHFV